MINRIKKALKELPRVELKGKFHELPDAKKQGTIAIDGGNGVIIDGGPWMLVKIKVGAVHYGENPWKKVLLNKPYMITKKAIYSEKKQMGLRFPNAVFENRQNYLRRFLEVQKASELLEKSGIIMMDMLLDSRFKKTNDLLESMKNSGKTIVGVAKTTRLGNGRSIVSELMKKPGEWFYKGPEGDFVRLNRKSRCYRVQIHGDEKKAIECLRYYSQDPEILGYPYPLVKADKIARVTDYELRSEKKKWSKELGEIAQDGKSMDMHSVLDMAMYR